MLLGLVVDIPPGEPRRRIVRALIVMVLMLLGLAALAGALWLLVRTAEYGWQTMDWERMSAAEPLPIYTIYLLLFPPAYLIARRPVPRQVRRALLDALEADDARVVKRAIPQPDPLAAEELAQLGTGPLPLAPLRPLEGGYNGSSNFNPAILWVGLLIEQAGLMLTNLTRALGGDQTWRLFGLTANDLTLPLIVIGFLTLMVSIPMLAGTALFRRLRVTVSERGLAWRRRGPWAPQRHTEWSGVRAYWRASYSPLYATVPAVTYVVETESGIFGWTLNSLSKDAEYAASERLTRLIATRTGLALRDLAPLMTDLAQAKTKFKRLRGMDLPEAVTSPLLAMRRRMWRVLLWWALPLVTLFAMLIAGPLIADSRLQAAQQNYYAGLAPRIVAQTPLYQDAFAADDGQWPVTQPTLANYEQRRAFANGVYTLNGQAGRPVLALGPAPYGDAVIAVSAHQDGEAGQDGVGLVLRSSADERNLLVFFVSSDGTWSFAHYLYNPSQPDQSWEYFAGGASEAILSGDSATNQLLVLARGPIYLLYINGTLVSSVSSAKFGPHNALASGYAGVYLNDGANSGSYTDFAVYPVQSPPSLSYI
jgi:hypothetical protein